MSIIKSSREVYQNRYAACSVVPRVVFLIHVRGGS
jgi:hypothetical protein